MPLVNYTFSQLIDFTRTTSATYVNSAGLIATTPASVNLLIYTQEFDNAAWGKNNVTIAANSTTAPDGTTTADTITASAGAAVHNTQQSASVAAQGAASFYVKAGTHNFVQILFGPNSNIYANFNVSTGVIGTVGSSATATISAVGNGWYRCAIVCTPGSAGNFRLAMISSNTSAFNESWTAAGTETIFAWGAQVENGSTATTYTRNYGGVYPPRFDYDPVTLAPKGLLIEEQRSNLLTYSEQFDNAAWTKSNATITANAATAPDGTSTADKLIETTAASTSHRTSQGATTTASPYTYSVYLKAGERSFALLYTDAANAGVMVNLSTGATNTVAGINAPTSSSVTNAGNGWYRCVMTFTATAAVNTAFVYLATNSTTYSYTGDGTSGIYIWGAQLEAGAFATSYIPTVASQVTRTADVATIQAPMFAPWYNSTQGTFTVEFQTIQSGLLSQTIYALAMDTSGSKRIVYIGNGSDVANTFDGTTIIGAVGDVTGPVSKVASAYDASGRAIVSNGGTVATGTVAAGYSASSSLNIGSLGGGQSFGWIRSVRYYPTKLTNAQLQALTA